MTQYEETERLTEHKRRRERIATAALQSLIRNYPGNSADLIAGVAVNLADALMKELEQR